VSPPAIACVADPNAYHGCKRSEPNGNGAAKPKLVRNRQLS
jgi:hypothetical protein